jgi:hypothetical protein
MKEIISAIVSPSSVNDLSVNIVHLLGEPAVIQMARLPWTPVPGHTVCLAAAQSIQAWRLASNASQGFQLLRSQLFPMNMMAFSVLFEKVALAQEVKVVAELAVLQDREVGLRV